MSNIGGLQVANALLAQTVRLNLKANRTSLTVTTASGQPQKESADGSPSFAGRASAGVDALAADERLSAVQDASRDSQAASASLTTIAHLLGRMRVADDDAGAPDGSSDANLTAQLHDATNAAQKLLPAQAIARLRDVAAAGAPADPSVLDAALQEVQHAQGAAAADILSLTALVDGGTLGAVNRRAANESVSDIEAARTRTAFTKEQLLTDVEGALRVHSKLDPSEVFRLFR